MAERQIKRALISVYDKTGIVDFARALVNEFGIEIISTGGTASLLKENGIPVTLVEQVTGFPEMLDGRVKTLHPKIHAAILADRDNPDHMRQLKEQGIQPIDMVVVNLYPFEKTVADPNCTFEQAIEMIDIGGPCLLRAAAKNYRNILVLSDVCHYKRTLKYLRDDLDDVNDWPLWLMTKVFQNTAPYDMAIHSYFATRYWETPFTPALFVDLSMMNPTTANELHYGENPHQRAALYELGSGDGWSVVGAKLLQEEGEPSFNNFADANAGLELCAELTRAKRGMAACVMIKHTNACGVGIADTQIEAFRRSYLGDPNAAMGGILACNFVVKAEFARTVMKTYDCWGKDAGAGGFFLEVWIAEDFDDDAIKEIRRTKKWGKRVQLLGAGDMSVELLSDELEFRALFGGVLAQTRDLVGLNEDQWKVVTKRAPSESEISDLRLAWLIAKHTKSNAISICKDGMLIGNGAGQMSRVMSCRIATWLAKENGHADKLPGSVAASDAFFPFPDGPNLLMDAGVTAIIQPGGSKRDEETIAACDARNVAMIFTGTRHFRH
jgi:phosphoribosylaminoimidazolecarboxamide formyltransferase/IMP cyclohydrolase